MTRLLHEPLEFPAHLGRCDGGAVVGKLREARLPVETLRHMRAERPDGACQRYKWIRVLGAGGVNRRFKRVLAPLLKRWPSGKRALGRGSSAASSSMMRARPLCQVAWRRSPVGWPPRRLAPRASSGRAALAAPRRWADCSVNAATDSAAATPGRPASAGTTYSLYVQPPRTASTYRQTLRKSSVDELAILLTDYTTRACSPALLSWCCCRPGPAASTTAGLMVAACPCAEPRRRSYRPLRLRR